ncbi:MAG TPA: ATP-binding cassette domain-containing protein [Nannocystis sp.]
MIEVIDLTKSFPLPRQRRSRDAARALWAVAGATFTCRPGRVFALLGPNGAGKTTLLRMIAALLRPDSGRIRIAGVDALADPVAARRRLGFLTGSTRLYERLTAEENVRYAAELHGVTGADYRRRRDHLFGALGIDAFADRRAGQLSTGMKQKVAIARTMIHDPEVVVFDEATSGLDVIAARAIIELVRRCRAEGKTVLFSTHIMSEVTMLADDLAVVHRGKLLACGGLDELLARAVDEHGRRRSLEDEFVRLIDATGEPVADEPPLEPRPGLFGRLFPRRSV